MKPRAMPKARRVGGRRFRGGGGAIVFMVGGLGDEEGCSWGGERVVVLSWELGPWRAFRERGSAELGRGGSVLWGCRRHGERNTWILNFLEWKIRHLVHNLS